MFLSGDNSCRQGDRAEGWEQSRTHKKMGKALVRSYSIEN